VSTVRGPRGEAMPATDLPGGEEMLSEPWVVDRKREMRIATAIPTYTLIGEPRGHRVFRA
jgi:hypothetical protein